MSDKLIESSRERREWVLPGTGNFFWRYERINCGRNMLENTFSTPTRNSVYISRNDEHFFFLYSNQQHFLENVWICTHTYRGSNLF